MDRGTDDILRRSDLHNPAEIHHSDPAAHMLHDQEVMCDEQIRDTQFLLQVLKGIDDLRLNGNVKRGNRFVADDKARVDRQRPGNSDSLPLAAGKLAYPCGNHRYSFP